MAAAAINSTNQIRLSFSWSGPTRGSGPLSPLSVEVIDLLSLKKEADVFIDLPDSASPLNINAPFSVRQLFSARSLEGRALTLRGPAVTSETLMATVEEIRNLTLRAGFFEPSAQKGPATLDRVTGKITRQEFVHRSNREIALKIPEDLRSGRSYCLKVTSSRDLSLLAELMADSESAAVSDGAPRSFSLEEIQKWQLQIQNLMKMMLRPVMMALVRTCGQEIDRLGLECDLNLAVDEDPHYGIKMADSLIETEVARLGPDQLAKMHALLELFESRASTTPTEDRKVLVGIVLDSFSPDRLTRLVHSHLDSFFKSDDPRSAFIQPVIDELSGRLAMAWISDRE
jgi:hypothetical protein